MATRKKSLLAEFKDFILRGDVVALAVGVVMALAFKTVVDAFVDIITNIVAIVGGHTQFNALAFHIRGGTFHYGALIQAIISFIVVAAAVFFLVIKPYNYLLERRKRGVPEPESDDRPCPQCLSDIPKAASRCAFCTSPVTPAL
jgi:large conductance mechanosensitive channel